MAYKLTVRLGDEYREKLEILFNHFEVNSKKELFQKMIDFFFERQKQSRLDKLEMRIEELANRIAMLEFSLKGKK